MNAARWLMFSDYILILGDAPLPWSEKAGSYNLLIVDELVCLRENCLCRIFLPEVTAIQPSKKAFYAQFDVFASG